MGFMTQIKNYDMKLAKEFGQIAQAVTSRPTNILKRIEKANDKVDFSNGRFQEIAIDIEHISEDISSKNYESMETLENMFLELLKKQKPLTKNDDCIVSFNVTEFSEADRGIAAEHIMQNLFSTMKFDSDMDIDGFVSQLRWYAHCEGMAARSDYEKDGNLIKKIK